MGVERQQAGMQRGIARGYRLSQSRAPGHDEDGGQYGGPDQPWVHVALSERLEREPECRCRPPGHSEIKLSDAAAS